MQAEEPSLPEMTAKAIELLANSKSSKGFYLQVEGALIDKRSHANDAAQTLEEMRAFDQAVAVAKAYAKHDGHTLVIVTADHGAPASTSSRRAATPTPRRSRPRPTWTPGNTANNSTPSRAASGAKDPVRSSGFINGDVAADPVQLRPATFRTPGRPRGRRGRIAGRQPVVDLPVRQPHRR